MGRKEGLMIPKRREGGYRRGYVEQIDVNNVLGACLGQAVIDDRTQKQLS